MAKTMISGRMYLYPHATQFTLGCLPGHVAHILELSGFFVFFLSALSTRWIFAFTSKLWGFLVNVYFEGLFSL